MPLRNDGRAVTLPTTGHRGGMGCGQLGYSEVAFTEHNRVPGVVPSVVALNMPLYGAARTVPREASKSACRNCAFPRELESQTEALAVVWRIYDKSCWLWNVSVDHRCSWGRGGRVATPMEWRDGGREKTKKFRVSMAPWYNGACHRWSKERARGVGHQKMRIRQVGFLRGCA